MTISIDKKIRRRSRKKRATLVGGSKQRPRVVLSESSRYLRVQAINDEVGHTLFYSSTEGLAKENNVFSHKSKDCAKKLGESFADKLKKGGIEKIVFDRNARPYHGKVKVFCETMRELGINF